MFEFTMMAPMTFFKNASFIKIFAIREFFNVKFLFYFDEKITFLRKKISTGFVRQNLSTDNSRSQSDERREKE